MVDSFVRRLEGDSGRPTDIAEESVLTPQRKWQFASADEVIE
jgi:hypothetical protein